jgi:hypothetical protein
MRTLASALNITDDWLLWIVLALLLLLVVLVGQKAGARTVHLKDNSGYTHPMLAFELNAGAAPDMFTSWDECTKSQLRTALLWDYLFIFLYPASIATACFIAARFLDRKGYIPFKYSLIVISLQLIAALFDATENFALLKVLSGPIESPWPQLARACAISKFGLVIVGVLYAIGVGGGSWLVTLVFKRN